MKTLFFRTVGSTKPVLDQKTEVHLKYTTGVVADQLSEAYSISMNHYRDIIAEFDQPAVYDIVVSGTISAGTYAYFQGITASSNELKDGKTITVLTGLFTDQAELGKILNLIYEQQLAIISVHKRSD